MAPVLLESSLDLGELVEHLGHRARLLLDQSLLLQRVVAADRHHEMGRVRRHGLELALDV